MQPRPRKTVLVVEDHEDKYDEIRAVFAESRSFDFQVRFVSNAQEHADAIREEEFDVYVVDLELDHPTDSSLYLGNIVIEAQSMERPGVPIVVYSAHGDAKTVAWAMNQGATDFVPKGTDGIERLRTCVETHLHDLEQREDEIRLVEEWLISSANVPHAGDRFLVFARGRPEASGPTRFDALLSYREVRLKHPELPAKPVLLDLGHHEADPG